MYLVLTRVVLATEIGFHTAENELSKILNQGFNSLQRLESFFIAKVKALRANLRDRSNPDFLKAVRDRDVPASVLAGMASVDMASAEKKAERARICAEAREAAEADWEARHGPPPSEGAMTCGKCHGNNTWYFQFQTRSCDEPMEVFVMCRSCKHGWRHNDFDPDDIFRQVWSK